MTLETTEHEESAKAPDAVAWSVRFVVRNWQGISRQRAPGEVVFARGRHVVVLGRDYARDIAHVLSVHRSVIERMKASDASRVWLFVGKPDGSVAVFVGDGLSFYRADGGANV